MYTQTNNAKKADACAPTQDNLYRINSCKKQDKYTIAQGIMQRLSVGRATRTDLKQLTGLSDRTLRELIQTMRRAGAPIINLSDGKGYKLAESPEELEHYKRQEYSRANEIFRTVNAMQIGNDLQMSMFIEG